MQLRVTVALVFLDDVTFAECEAWMRSVGYDGDDAWERLRTEAGVKSKLAMIKMRWNQGEAPEDRRKILGVLVDAERHQKKKTDFARRALLSESWAQIGEALCYDLDRFERAIAELRPVAAEAVARAAEQYALQEEANKKHARAAAELADVLSSPTPAPKGERK